MDIIVDIDGTISDCRNRLHYVYESPRNWEQFFAELIDDAPIKPIINLINSFYNPDNCEQNIILCTGRPEEHRTATVAWIRFHGVAYDKLYMRKKGDYRGDSIIKKELLQQMRNDGFNPELVIDDRQSVVDMWRKEGLICLQMAFYTEK
jgi:hypothetical protein